MQNYYRLLGIAASAAAPEIEQAYQRQVARAKRMARIDRTMKARLVELEGGYSILMNPRRRAAYDLLLAQDPATLEARSVREHGDFPWAVRVGRSVNMALLLCCLFFGLDWALPLREYPNEEVLSRFPVSVASYLSDPQIAYRVRTPHATFRMPSKYRHRVLPGQRITVWTTPLLGVVQRISAPKSPDGPAPFRPYAGTIYGVFGLLPILMGLISAVGIWPRIAPNTVINTAAVSGLLAVITAAVLLIF